MRCSSEVRSATVADRRPREAGSACRASRRAGRRRRRRTGPARAAAARGGGRARAGRGCRRRPAPSRAPAAPGWSRRPGRCNRCRPGAMPARSRARASASWQQSMVRSTLSLMSRWNVGALDAASSDSGLAVRSCSQAGDVALDALARRSARS